MKLLLDTNVILDLLLDRASFSEDAQKIFLLAETNEAVECVSASAITDIYYIVKKGTDGRKAAREAIEKLLSILKILPVTESVIQLAHDLDWEDFEDAVQYSAAKLNGADYIITRNGGDYERSDIKIMSPREFLDFFYSND